MDKITIKEAIVAIKEVSIETTLVLGDGRKLVIPGKLQTTIEADLLSVEKGKLAAEVLNAVQRQNILKAVVEELSK